MLFFAIKYKKNICKIMIMHTIKEIKMYYTYMLRCADHSIYTGITTDIKRRLSEHIAKGNKCAKYTWSHSAIKIEAAWESHTRSSASKLEYYIKTLTKAQKEELIKNKKLEVFLSNKIEISQYKII